MSKSTEAWKIHNPETENPRTAKTKDSTLNLTERKILLVTKHNGDRLGAKAHLHSWNIQVTVSMSIVDAFVLIQRSAKDGTPFDTILFDSAQFEITPGQFYQCINNEQTVNTPVVVVLGGPQSDADTQWHSLSGNIISLPTPLDKTALFTALHRSNRATDDTDDIINLSDHYSPSPVNQPLEILLATADIRERERLKRLLSRHKHQVFSVSDGKESLDALDSHHFDLAIVDAQLPDISGADAIKMYRFSRLDQPWSPFILLLDDPTTQEIKELEHAGITSYISKPIDNTNIVKAIEKVMGNAFEQEAKSVHTNYAAAPVLSAEKLHLDYQRLAEIEELGSPDFLKALVKQYQDDNEKTLEEMESAIDSSDFVQFNDLGHRLRDCAGNIGALRLFQLSIRSIRLKETDFIPEAHRILSEIKEAYHESVHLLKMHIKMSDNSAHR